MSRYDLIVIGGGPAGSTLSCLAKKYNPEKRVLLIEKSPGPRHHIGESLIPGLVPVLREMGAFDKIDQAGFPRKLGATYVWGPERRPWENDFNEINIQEMIQRYGKIPERIEYAWQVRRSRYDEILLQHAQDSGVEVRRAVQATGIIEQEGRVAGVVVRDAQDRETSLEAEFTADCSGQSGFLSKFRRIREHDQRLKNVAAYAYFRGARWKYEYSGHPDKTRIFVCSVGCGWFWYIPIEKDLVSVGLVTTTDYVKRKRIKNLRSLFMRELKKCKEIAPLLKKATIERDFEGTGRDFFTQSDWSYLNVAAAGPGWLAAGDSAVFVDPILSTGVTLAHHCAHRAAYTLGSHWREMDPAIRHLLWAYYNSFCRESAAQYLALALFWYGNDRHSAKWWARAMEIQRAWLGGQPVDMADKQAFINVSSGLTRTYEHFLSTTQLLQESATKPEEYPFYRSVLKAGPRPDAPLHAGHVPVLSCPWREEYAFLPTLGEGVMKPVKRVIFLKHAEGDAAREVLNPRHVVTRYHLELLRLIDGRRSMEELRAELKRKGLADWWLAAPLEAFLRELAVQGVLVASEQEPSRA